MDKLKMSFDFWYLSCNDNRDLSEINPTMYMSSGNLYKDLATLSRILKINLHPAFRPRPSTDFTAISCRFDAFSFKVLTIAILNVMTPQIKFNNCNLEDWHLTALASLVTKDHVNWLQVDWNPGLSPVKYSNLCATMSKLSVLSLRSCSLSQESVVLIGKNLLVNKHLKTLDLYGNRINDLTPFAEVLEVNRTLESLNLACNGINDHMVKPLVGIFGRLTVTAEFVKKEKENNKFKKQNSKLETADEIVVNSQGSFFIKNKVFKRLNLGMNRINRTDNIEQILEVSLPCFQVFLSENPLCLDRIKRKYPDKVF